MQHYVAKGGKLFLPIGMDEAEDWLLDSVRVVPLLQAMDRLGELLMAVE